MQKIKEATKILKQLGYTSERSLQRSIHPKVYETYFTATAYELNYALNKKDYAWIKLRLNHAKD